MKAFGYNRITGFVVLAAFLGACVFSNLIPHTHAEPVGQAHDCSNHHEEKHQAAESTPKESAPEESCPTCQFLHLAKAAHVVEDNMLPLGPTFADTTLSPKVSCPIAYPYLFPSPRGPPAISC